MRRFWESSGAAFLLVGSVGTVQVASFVPASDIAAPSTTIRTCSGRGYNYRAICLNAKDGDDGDGAAASLPPAIALPPSTTSDADQETTKPALAPTGDSLDEQSQPQPAQPATTALFINQQTKRILIEELGYKRAEVERLRPELAQPIVNNRTFRPSEGVPEDWMMAEEDTTRAMLDKLESENKYPLKFPLLAVGTILFGKGFGDALITIIKVNIDFPGATLTEDFMGVPVLAIDAACVLAGAALASWTWNTVKD